MSTTRIRLAAIVVLLSFALFLDASINIDTDFIRQTIVFIYKSDRNGQAASSPTATGFLVAVPKKENPTEGHILLITARHVVKPQWACPSEENPSRIFLRLNKRHFDPSTDSEGVGYVSIDLTRRDHRRVFVPDDERVDVAVVLLSRNDIDLNEYAVKALPLTHFGLDEEVEQLGIGDDVVSAGLIPAFPGAKRNYPFFKFGKISNIPNEPTAVPCHPPDPPRLVKVWFVAASLVEGNSGSPIFYVPAGAGGVQLGGGRPLLLGVQSLSLGGVYVAGMTRVAFLFEVIRSMNLQDADLHRGPVVARDKGKTGGDDEQRR